MRRFMLIALGVVAAGAMTLLAGSPALAAATATSTTYSFDLASGDTAVSPNGGTMCGTTMAGDWIGVTGSGTFNPTVKTVQAKGSFTHYNSSGTVMCQGTWKATGFTSFTGFGTNDQGQDGGVLSIVVTHYCKTIGMTMTGIPMTVTSTINAPTGYTEGTTVGDFTQPTGGAVVIQPDQ